MNKGNLNLITAEDILDASYSELIKLQKRIKPSSVLKKKDMVQDLVIKELEERKFGSQFIFIKDEEINYQGNIVEIVSATEDGYYIQGEEDIEPVFVLTEILAEENGIDIATYVDPELRKDLIVGPKTPAGKDAKKPGIVTVKNIDPKVKEVLDDPSLTRNEKVIKLYYDFKMGIKDIYPLVEGWYYQMIRAVILKTEAEKAEL